jgi:hypothetical protein
MQSGRQFSSWGNLVNSFPLVKGSRGDRWGRPQTDVRVVQGREKGDGPDGPSPVSCLCGRAYFRTTIFFVAWKPWSVSSV